MRQLAIAGDKVDNIPGIPGIGMTIAGRLLTKFETLSKLRQNVQQIGSMKFRGAERIMNLVQQHEAILDISSRLTPVDCGIEAMREVDIKRRQPDRQRLLEIMDFQQMGQSRQLKWQRLLDSVQAAGE